MCPKHMYSTCTLYVSSGMYKMHTIPTTVNTVPVPLCVCSYVCALYIQHSSDPVRGWRCLPDYTEVLYHEPRSQLLNTQALSYRMVA